MNFSFLTSTSAEAAAIAYNQSLQPNTTMSTTLRPYTTASNFFEANDGGFIPKSKNWFHVFFEINQDVLSTIDSVLSGLNSENVVNWNKDNIPYIGLLVKNVRVPSVKFEVKKHNNYNRWDLTSTKATYDPIDITFWDDTVSLVKTLWFAYYQYMIQEPYYPSYDQSQLNIPNKLDPVYSGNVSIYNNTAFSDGTAYGMNTVDGNGYFNRDSAFFKSIRIFQFSRATDNTGAKYTEYCLVNPVITSFEGDQLDMSSSEGCTNRMGIEYETLLYNGGTISTNIPSWESIKEVFLDTTRSFMDKTTSTSTQNSTISSSDTAEVQSADLSDVSISSDSSYSSVLDSPSVEADDLSDVSVDSSTSSGISVPTSSSTYGVSGMPPVSGDTYNV